MRVSRALVYLFTKQWHRGKTNAYRVWPIELDFDYWRPLSTLIFVFFSSYWRAWKWFRMFFVFVHWPSLWMNWHSFSGLRLLSKRNLKMQSTTPNKYLTNSLRWSPFQRLAHANVWHLDCESSIRSTKRLDPAAFPVDLAIDAIVVPLVLHILDSVAPTIFSSSIRHWWRLGSGCILQGQRAPIVEHSGSGRSGVKKGACHE